jgi:hypothetical protein
VPVAQAASTAAVAAAPKTVQRSRMRRDRRF